MKLSCVDENYGFDDPDQVVRAAFDQAVDRLKAADYMVVCESLPALEKSSALQFGQFSSVESRAEYEDFYQSE